MTSVGNNMLCGGCWQAWSGTWVTWTLRTVCGLASTSRRRRASTTVSSRVDATSHVGRVTACLSDLRASPCVALTEPSCASTDDKPSVLRDLAGVRFAQYLTLFIIYDYLQVYRKIDLRLRLKKCKNFFYEYRKRICEHCLGRSYKFASES